jgi:hypothetical protein
MPRCPQCNAKPRFRARAWTDWVWRPQVCSNCGAKLRFDLRQFRLFMTLMLAGFAVQIVGNLTQQYALAICGSLILLAALFANLIFRRLEVIDRGPFCPRCEYDLSSLGDHVACPECGWPDT